MSTRQPRCADCGHPAGKHARGAQGGCNVRVPVRPAGWRGNGSTPVRDCPCGQYRAEAPAPAMTPAELIERDRARLAAAGAPETETET